MKKAPIPEAEAERLKALYALRLLDTAPEERFDRFTRLARRTFDVPIVLVTFVDANRQWFKSNQGLNATETARDISFCGHAIMQPEVMVIPDALADPRFSDNPLVTGDPQIRFYAGCPIAAPAGQNIGTICLIDQEPRDLDPEDVALLRDLGRMVEDDLASRAAAVTDELTGISNRRGFLKLAGMALSMCDRMEKPASLVFIDLDGFKAINDVFGHAEGDAALREMAQILLDTFRDSDVIARMGGDEFAVLCTGVQDVGIPIRRLEECLAARNEDAEYGLDCSVGHVDFDTERHATIDDLIREADSRMYERKRGGAAAG